jgi:hypothetical protein
MGPERSDLAELIGDGRVGRPPAAHQLLDDRDRRICSDWAHLSAKVRRAMMRDGDAERRERWLAHLARQHELTIEWGAWSLYTERPEIVRYLRELKRTTRREALRQLQREVEPVIRDYVWTRTAARKIAETAEDEAVRVAALKETRIAASDHLDRLNVTQRKDAPVVQVAVVELHSRNFDAANLLAPSPEMLGEDDPPETP